MVVIEKLIEVGFGIDFVPAEVLLSIDPSDSSTGIALWSMAPRVAPIRARLVDITKAGFTQDLAIDILDRMIGSARWRAVIERPPPLKRGLGNAPTHAERFWLGVLDLLARRRCVRAGLKFRKPPIDRPNPGQWRGIIGIPIKGVGSDRLARRAWLKAKAVEYLLRAHNIILKQDDMAEAVCIGDYQARLLSRDARLTKVGETRPRGIFLVA